MTPSLQACEPLQVPVAAVPCKQQTLQPCRAAFRVQRLAACIISCYGFQHETSQCNGLLVAARLALLDILFNLQNKVTSPFVPSSTATSF